MSDSDQKGSRGRRLLWIVGGAATLVLAIGLVFQGLTADLRPEEEDRDAVLEPTAVNRDLLRETVVAAGAMEPLVRVPVISEVSGVIDQVNVDEGERVVRGQPLFELDRERLEARVAERSAELDLRQANARYDLVGRARAMLDHAQREHARTLALNERNVASVQDRERTEHELRLAEIGLRDAHAEMAARRAAVAAAREMLRQAERDLENAVIRAPIDGVVIEREGEIGRAVADVTKTGGTIIAVIADDRRIRLVSDVDENEIASVRVGQDAEISIDAFPEETFSGRVRKISAAGTTIGSVSNFEVEIELDPDERLRVGMSADARIIVREYRDALLIPNRALVRREGAIFVRRTDVGGGGSYELIPVTIGYSDGFQTVVHEGLAEGDVVLERLADSRG